MTGRAKAPFLPPLVCAGIGAGVAFYGLHEAPIGTSALSAILGLLVSACCLAVAEGRIVAVAVTSLPTVTLPRNVRCAAYRAIAFCGGFLFGIAALWTPGNKPHFGLPLPAIRSIVGSVASDTRRVPGGRLQYRIDLLEAEGSAGQRTSASGSLTVFSDFSDLGGILARGSVVRLTGKIKEDDAGGAIFARSTELHSPAPRVEAQRSRLRGNLLERLESRPWGGLAGALLIGSKDGLTGSDSRAYADAGCAHILALSGMHLAVISALIAALLRPILGLKGAAVSGGVLVFFYVYLAGAQPSLIRAAIMYSIGAIGILFGLPRRALPFLALAFLIQLPFDTVSARGLSFTLSYAALAGILVVADPADDLLRSTVPTLVRASLAASVGAFLATAGIAAHAFGMLRPIGLAASLILTPLANILMVGSLAWLALDSLFPPLGLLADLVLTVVADINVTIVDRAAAVPGLQVSQTAAGVAASLACSFFLVYGRYLRNKARHRIDPIA